MLLAHDGDDFVGGVGIVGVGEDVLGGVVAVGVFVAAEDVNGVAADAHAGAGDEALIDGVADGGVGGACAFGAHVALSGIAGEEIIFGGLFGEEHAPGDGFFDGLQIFSAGMKEEMHVGVDEAGEQSGVAEVDEFGVGRVRDGCADGGDAFAFDKDFAGLEKVAGVDLKEASGVEDDRRGAGRLLCGRRDGMRDYAEGEHADLKDGWRAQAKAGHGYDYGASCARCRWVILRRVRRENLTGGAFSERRVRARVRAEGDPIEFDPNDLAAGAGGR